jgi:hypothetical protein
MFLFYIPICGVSRTFESKKGKQRGGGGDATNCVIRFVISTPVLLGWLSE